MSKFPKNTYTNINSKKVNSNNNSIISTSNFSYNYKLVKIYIYFKFGIFLVHSCVLPITTLLFIRVNSAILDQNSYLWGPINNSGNNGWILELFFLKHIRISPRIHCHHLQLNPRSVEASGEMASLGVNISPKWNSQNGSMVFLGSPEGP